MEFLPANMIEEGFPEYRCHIPLDDLPECDGPFAQGLFLLFNYMIFRKRKMKYWNQEKNPLVRAYRHGYHYGHLFLRATLNPHPASSKFFAEWERGWKAGAAFSVKQADIAREMVRDRPSRKARLTARETGT